VSSEDTRHATELGAPNHGGCGPLGQILYGNLAPEGSVAKITGKEGLVFEGTAICFDSEEDMLAALSENTEQFKGTVIVIRYEGPKGGPGMPEMLTPTSAIMGAGLGKECALLTDGASVSP
jgi:dihydroxy-acid dehydratase